MGLFSIIFSLLLTNYSSANPYGKRSGRLAFDIKTSFFSTTENLDNSGDIVDLAAAHDYEEIKTNIRSEYDYSRNLTLYGDLTVNSATSNDGIAERSETAMSDLTVGFEYVLSRGTFMIMPSFQIKAPLKTYSEDTDSIIITNNSMDVEGLLHVSKRFRPFYVRGYAGLTYRTEGFSMLLPLGAEVLYNSRRFTMAGGIESYFSITDDDYASDEDRRTDVTNRVNGGSLTYYSVNPSLTKVYALAKFYLEPQLYLGGGVKQSIFGESAAYGTEFFANFGFSFGGERARKLTGLKAQDLDSNTEEFEFKFDEDTDKDEDVFNTKAPIRYKEESVDQKLNNVEKDIEIKLKKKPK
jgi:hypothetical protein